MSIGAAKFINKTYAMIVLRSVIVQACRTLKIFSCTSLDYQATKKSLST